MPQSLHQVLGCMPEWSYGHLVIVHFGASFFSVGQSLGIPRHVGHHLLLARLPALHSKKNGQDIYIRETPDEGDSATGTALVAGDAP